MILTFERKGFKGGMGNMIFLTKGFMRGIGVMILLFRLKVLKGKLAT